MEKPAPFLLFKKNKPAPQLWLGQKKKQVEQKEVENTIKKTQDYFRDWTNVGLKKQKLKNKLEKFLFTLLVI